MIAVFVLGLLLQQAPAPAMPKEQQLDVADLTQKYGICKGVLENKVAYADALEKHIAQLNAEIKQLQTEVTKLKSEPKP